MDFLPVDIYMLADCSVRAMIRLLVDLSTDDRHAASGITKSRANVSHDFLFGKHPTFECTTTHVADHRCEGSSMQASVLRLTSQLLSYRYQSVSHTSVTDFCLPPSWLLLNLQPVNGLQMRQKEKRVVQFVPCLGFFVCIVSCVRFYGLYAIAVTKDPSHDNPQVAVLSNVEASVCIIASCVPTLKGLTTRYYPTLFTTQESHSTSRGDSIELGGIKSGAGYTVHVERVGAQRASRLAGRFGSRSGVMEIGDGGWASSQSQLPGAQKANDPEKHEIRVYRSVEQSRQAQKYE